MDIDIRTLLGKLNPECKRLLERAAELCVQQTHYNVDIEHFLFKLIETDAPDIHLVFAQYDIKADAILRQLQSAMDGFKRGNGRTPALSPQLAPLLQEAWLLSSMLLGQQQVRSGTLLLAALDVDSLRGVLLESAPGLLQIPRENLRTNFGALLRDSTENAGGSGGVVKPEPVSAGANTTEAPKHQMPSMRRSGGTSPSLDLYTVDLTALARAGRMDPVQGRDDEIRQIMDVLLRRRQNNPILTGEAGVGKTAVVEGFALRIAQGSVPPSLQNVAVRSLDLALLQAGAGIKGEFENRLKSVIAEVKASAQPVILFIDEAHQLIGAGGAEGQGDAANILKPALARGELRTIAATTWSEYKKYIERDPALARRFQVVKVDEPDEDTAVDMLRGIVATLETHHGVEINDAAVRDAVKLSHRYITGRQLPDKAISVLDTACARVAISQNGVPPELEALERKISNADHQLRAYAREMATGTDHSAAHAALSEDKVLWTQKKERLGEQLAEEKLAVAEILALRRRIRGMTPALDSDKEDGAEWMSTGLARLEKGLEAIRNDEPLVSVCVDSAAVASVISGWTGIPIGKMLADELHAVLNLKDSLAKRVVGQDQALEAISRRVRTSRADLDSPEKPVGVFMLVGPSGVGKTETAFALADALYGGERNMVTVNMSEFQEAHTVSSLKGAPPGYVGFGKGGVLTEAVRRRPYSVVLLDEMEKAHPDVLELFFQVFDKGTMEDGEGVTIDFKNTLILLTSNAAQSVITDACAGAVRPPMQTLIDALRPELLKQFSPAFLGRLTVVPYYPLKDAQIRAIVKLKLEKLAQRFARNHNATLSWDGAVEDTVTARCTEVDSGARNVDHILADALLPELSRLVLERIAIADAFSTVRIQMDARKAFEFTFGSEAQG
ncbi:type VI secretion system ATPase TssH [Rhodoferax saidenbachensis]|uniref:ClpV1 family T6SS ATPase n=1 Tax=Rhodoferax saidenbachensis TaxID=1484693 RepID=A0A1P8KEF6_9BURK|nr:type VI secretion system ATPase TssH [Rhodoferax saidenbachensis]APW44417.1 ClpV1 family T6SS ATPase [Rhodoferax saidenbachensis]